MIRLALIPLFLMLTVGRLVSAQTATPTSTPAPWPPDPEDIFAEGITWSIVDEYAVSAEEPLSIDRKRRVLHFYDAASDTIREYLFPEGKEIHNAEIRSDGSISIDWVNSRGFSPDSTLILNPDTGEYEEPNLVCEDKVLQNLPGEGRWRVLKHSAGYGDASLCQTETDEQHTPKNLTLQWNSLISNVDETHLILMDYAPLTAKGIIARDNQVVLYELTNEHVTVLGTIPYWNEVDDFAYVCDWLTPTRGLLCVDNAAWDWAPLSYYAFDLTQPNSLEYVFSGWENTLFTLENPKRYFAIDSEYYSSRQTLSSTSDRPCQVTTYGEGGLRTHILGGSCIPVVVWLDVINAVYRVGNDFYYLAIEEIIPSFPPSATSSSLHRFDADTEMVSEALLTGEIEMLLAVSPDERYIAVIMDNNGILDFPWQAGQSLDKKRPLAILDTQSGKIVYQTEPVDVESSSDVAWIDNDTIIILSKELWRIDLSEDSARADRTSRYEWRNYNTCLKDENGFMVATDTERNTVLVNLATFESVPLLRGYPEMDYDVRYECYDGPITVRISPTDSYQDSVTYQVTLP